ncbi:uncharacterized protein LOC133744279 [Rosa rugosa]|uniref:uncharacterized protein LOC133744279 n=1 Tax=Rosa rugosa TaxID=74645 RepID=UPI002B40A167|nr:uncharacterized protein LOC133744279 [Rosa rugosa]
MGHITGIIKARVNEKAEDYMKWEVADGLVLSISCKVMTDEVIQLIIGLLRMSLYEERGFERQARVFAIGQGGTGVEGTISVYSYLARVLFDTGASQSFISSSVVDVLGLIAMPLTRSLCVTSPLGVSLELDMFCDDCPIGICSREFSASLIVIPDHTYDVILGMDWLSQNHAVIDCFRMIVSFRVPG